MINAIHSFGTENTRKKALILSDNPFLTQLISQDLSDQLEVQVFDIQEIQTRSGAADRSKTSVDFMVVAMSTPTNNPISALVKAGLDHHLGRIPMLIISNSPYYMASRSEVIRMGYPFEEERLQNSIFKMIQSLSH